MQTREYQMPLPHPRLCLITVMMMYYGQTALTD